MLKHNDIIAKLTDSQKVRLLTGVGTLTGKDFKILGLAGASVRNMKDYGRDIIPSYGALAHSWSRETWHSTAMSRLDMLSEDGAGFVIAPGAKIKLSPYRREITEDPYLSSELSAAHMRAAKERGFTVGASGYYLTEGELGWLDREPSERVLGEMLAAPYMRAAAEAGSDAVVTDIRSIGDAYRAVMVGLQDNIADSGWLVCEKANEENTVSLISRGVICLEGSANALEVALGRYNKLVGMAERGDAVTPDQISDELKRGSAISTEEIDKAVDTVLDFLESCERRISEGYDRAAAENAAREAVAQSAVLLKNKDRVLPLSKGESIAVIGNVLPERGGECGAALLARDLEARGYRCIGAEPGYEMNDIGAAHLRSRALKLAERASVVILLLGFGYENEKRIQKTEDMLLPADQMRLAQMLVKQGKRVIGVIASGHTVDVEFTREFPALMLMPLYVDSSAEVLAELISGERVPSGKLAYTLYAGSDAAFGKRALYRERYGLLSGPFIGYRYYATAGINVGYPFGHGLSYVRFEYSDLAVVGGEVMLTVTNTGKRAATETVQIYVGKKASSVLRPSLELSGFERVSLLPGEKKRVRISIDIPKVYNGKKYTVEAGAYTVYAGSSSSDIRLSARTVLNGSELPPDGERIADYIQSVTNVTEDNFTLEANYGFMKKSIKNLLFGIGALIIAASIAVFNATIAMDSVFLGIIAGIIAVCSVIFFICHFTDAKRSYKEHRAKVDSANKEHFAGAEEIPMLSTDMMFSEEFDNVELESEDTASDDSDYADELLRKYVDTEFSMSALVMDFVEFAKDKGIKLEHGVAERFMTSLATSMLIIVDGVTSEDFNTFVMLASEYFGTSAYVDRMELCEERGDMFFSTDTYGNSVKRPVLLALDAAASAKEKIFLPAIDGVGEGGIKEYLKPFLSYISSPKELNDIRIYNDLGANVGYGISKNVRLMVRLSDLASVDMLPHSVLSAAAYNIVSFVRSPIPEQPSSHHGCNRYQLDYMAGKDGRGSNITEDAYKKIDKLEKYASARGDFKIGNKQFLAFERQVGLIASVSGEITDALDSAIAVRLLASVSSAVRGKLTEDDESLKDTIEFTWGDEDMPACARFVALQQEAALRIADIKTRFAEEEARRLAEIAAAEEREAAEKAEQEAREAAEREAAEIAARAAEREAAERLEAERAAREALEAEELVAAESVSASEPLDMSSFDFENFDIDSFDPTPYGMTKEQFAENFAIMKAAADEAAAVEKIALQYGLDPDMVKGMTRAEAAEAAIIAEQARLRADADAVSELEENEQLAADVALDNAELDLSGFDFSGFDFENFDIDSFDTTPYGVTKEQFAEFFKLMKDAADGMNNVTALDAEEDKF